MHQTGVIIARVALQINWIKMFLSNECLMTWPIVHQYNCGHKWFVSVDLRNVKYSVTLKGDVFFSSLFRLSYVIYKADHRVNNRVSNGMRRQILFIDNFRVFFLCNASNYWTERNQVCVDFFFLSRNKRDLNNRLGSRRIASDFFHPNNKQFRSMWKWRIEQRIQVNDWKCTRHTEKWIKIWSEAFDKSEFHTTIERTIESNWFAVSWSIEKCQEWIRF